MKLLVMYPAKLHPQLDAIIENTAGFPCKSAKLNKEYRDLEFYFKTEVAAKAVANRIQKINPAIEVEFDD